MLLLTDMDFIRKTVLDGITLSSKHQEGLGQLRKMWEERVSGERPTAQEALETAKGILLDFYGYTAEMPAVPVYTEDLSGLGTEDPFLPYRLVLESCIESYGEPGVEDGPFKGGKHFTGLAFADLLDFDGDGQEELLLFFHVNPDGKKEGCSNPSVHAYVWNFWGILDGEPVFWQVGTGGIA